MKKSTMLATAAFAVLLGLFVPCTSHATEIKDTDPTTVQWDKATRKECTNSEGVSYVDYTFPKEQTQSYNSYDDAVTSLAKFTVDAVADHKSNYIILRVPVKIKTAQSVDEYQLQSDVEDKINSWIRFGGNMTKREILSFSGSDWKKHENLSSFYTYLDDYAYTGGELTGTFKIAVNYKTRYDFTEYETKCLNAIKEMNVDGKSDYDKALALCKWVNKHIKYKSSEVFLGDQSGMQGMMEGWGVCNAYATLTCYLGRCLGLDVLYEGGDTWLDSHAWNLVKVGDEWYYMDPTKSGNRDGLVFNISFLQGNDWLKCNTKELDDQFKDYNKIYKISDISYVNKHSTCSGEHNWIESPGGNSTENLKDSTCDLPYCIPYRCTKCNAVKWEYYKDPKGHTPGKVIRVDREANCYTEGLQVRECTVCGKGYWETIPMTQHHWVDGKCTICGDECTHTYGEKTIITPATCTTMGSYTKTCTTCGYVYKGQIPKTQHNYEWKVTTPATCNSTGVETKTCTNCGKTSGQRQIPATGEHNWETVETIPATCTSKEKQKQEYLKKEQEEAYAQQDLEDVSVDGTENANFDQTEESSGTDMESVIDADIQADETEQQWDINKDESEDDEKLVEEDDLHDNVITDDEIEEDTADILYTPSKAYVKKEDEYKDVKFSGITFIIFGILGIAYLTLCKLDIIAIDYNIFVFCVIAALFVGFIVMGVVSVVKSKKIKLQIPEEEILTEELNKWLEENITKERVEKWIDDSVSDEENDLIVMAHIRSILIKKYPDLNVSFIEMLTEEFFNSHFVEDAE